VYYRRFQIPEALYRIKHQPPLFLFAAFVTAKPANLSFGATNTLRWQHAHRLIVIERVNNDIGPIRSNSPNNATLVKLTA